MTTDNSKIFENPHSKDLNVLVPIQSTEKMSLELKPGVWNSSEHSGMEYVPNDAPPMYKLYQKRLLGYWNRRAAFENLHWTGAIPYTQYVAAMDDMSKLIEQTHKFYNVKSYSLLLVDRRDVNNPMAIKLFNDEYLLNYFLQNMYGITMADVMAGQVPEPMKGTRIFEQEWHTSMQDILTKYPKLDNFEGRPLDSGPRL